MIAIAMRRACAALLFLALPASTATPVAAEPKAEAKQEVVAVFDIAGMACDGCSSHLRDELAKLPHVVKAEVWFTQKKARLTFASQDKVDKPAVLNLVKKEGYTATFVAIES